MNQITALPDAFESLASRNEEMQRCLDLAVAASRTTASVLITGESGTGKNMMAQAIHAASDRAGKPCITINCSAIPENLLEGELFGLESTQASQTSRRGKLELADGGTLILDEITAMPASVQSKLLRAVEYGQYERVDGEETLTTDTRVIGISSQNVATLVAEGQFREDLYYRINEITIQIPPLRMRREDLSELINGFIAECNEKFAKSVQNISQITLDYLMRYDFPGNLRELRSLIKRGVTVAKGDLLWLEDLGMRVEVPSEVEAGEDPEEAMSLATVEKRHIQHVLDYTKGNKKRTSEILKVSRPTLDRKIKIYGLRVP